MYKDWLKAVDQNLKRYKPGIRVTDIDSQALSNAFQSSLTPYEFATQATLPLVGAGQAAVTASDAQSARNSFAVAMLGILVFAGMLGGAFLLVDSFFSLPEPALVDRQENRILAEAPEPIDPVRGPKPKADRMYRGMTQEVDLALRISLNDYDSVKDLVALPVEPYGEHAWAQVISFRAKNGFGAYTLTSLRFVIKNGDVIDVQDVK